MTAIHPLRLGILASHGGSNMQAILDAIAAGRLDARAVLVISNNSQSGALERARRAAVPWRHLSGETHPDPSELDKAITTALQDAGTELICLAGYMKKIGPQLLSHFRGRIINIHPALLPRHGGAGMFGIHPHEAAIAAGDLESGATVHLVNNEYDRGVILGQRRVPVHGDDTAHTLQQRVLAVEHQLFPEILSKIATGLIPLPIPQDYDRRA